MLTYKEKWGKTFNHTVQSMGMGKWCPPPQPTRGSGGASLAPSVGSGAEPWPKTVLVHFRRLQKTHLMAINFAFLYFHIYIFKNIFPGLSRSWIFQEKKSRTFQDSPGGVGTLFTAFNCKAKAIRLQLPHQRYTGSKIISRPYLLDVSAPLISLTRISYSPHCRYGYISHAAVR